MAKWSTLLLLQQRITEDLEEQSRVKEVVLANYVTLVEVFKHYASVGSAVATGEIDIMEVRACAHPIPSHLLMPVGGVVQKIPALRAYLACP